MAIELSWQREARVKAEAGCREANIKRYEQSMGVQLPYSPVAVVERRPEGEGTSEQLKQGDAALREPSNVKPKAAKLESNIKVNVKPTKAGPEVNIKPAFDRKEYMRDYMKKARAKEKKCPHCGGKL